MNLDAMYLSSKQLGIDTLRMIDGVIPDLPGLSVPSEEEDDSERLKDFFTECSHFCVLCTRESCARDVQNILSYRYVEKYHIER